MEASGNASRECVNTLWTRPHLLNLSGTLSDLFQGCSGGSCDVDHDKLMEKILVEHTKSYTNCDC